MQKLFFFLILLISISSCVNNKRLVYVQNDKLTSDKAVQYSNTRSEYTLQPNDVLNISVKSTQPELTEIFNIVGGNSMNWFNSPGSFYVAGYNVSDSGNISLPTIGKVKVQGLTLSKATNVIQQAINKYVNDATVFVKLVSFKISVLGEVKNPGYYYIYNNQATVLEGLGLAGDIADFGNRNKIKLIRQTNTGSEVAQLDITDPNIMKSKYFYLLPNDVLYVEPLRAKAARGNLAQLGILFSGVTTLVLILNYANNNF